MSATTSADQANEQASNEFEGEIREFVRKDVAPWRKRPEPAAEAPPAENVSMLVQRVAGASLGEIDRVIEDLRNMREFLRNEGDRVQREIAGYATVSQAAAASMKVISESMEQWRSSATANAPGTPPAYRG